MCFVLHLSGASENGRAKEHARQRNQGDRRAAAGLQRSLEVRLHTREFHRRQDGNRLDLCVECALLVELALVPCAASLLHPAMVAKPIAVGAGTASQQHVVPQDRLPEDAITW